VDVEKSVVRERPTWRVCLKLSLLHLFGSASNALRACDEAIRAVTGVWGQIIRDIKDVIVDKGGDRIDCTEDRLRAADAADEWVKRDEVDNGVREGVTTVEAQRMKELEREVKELRRANEILKLASAFFAQAELDRRLKS
jgi:hypothetical protein